MSVQQETVSESEFHLSEAERLKLPLTVYSEKSGVALKKLRYWRKKVLAKRVSVAESGLAFQRICFQPSGLGRYVITIGAHSLELPSGFRDEEVSRIIKILKRH